MTDAEKKILEKYNLNEDDLKPKDVNPIDAIEAQVLYTALMTDTLIEG